MMNQVALMGRLTADPELRYTNDNTPICSFSVAVDRDSPDRDGERKTDFFDVVAWRQHGEFIAKYFHRGDLIGLTGRLASRNWTDRNGTKRVSIEVQVQGSYFTQQRPRQTAATEPGPSGLSDLSSGYDGELPF